MDIQILNETVVDTACNNATSSYLPQLDSEISELETVLSSIKTKWSSNGMDKESYIVELEKQIRNLQKIKTATLQLFISIANYSANAKQISSQTVDMVIGGSYQGANVSAGYGSAANAVSQTGGKTIKTQYVNEDSTVDTMIAVDASGKEIARTSEAGISASDFASQVGVSTDQVAMRVSKGGVAQTWVNAADYQS